MGSSTAICPTGYYGRARQWQASYFNKYIAHVGICDGIIVEGYRVWPNGNSVENRQKSQAVRFDFKQRAPHKYVNFQFGGIALGKKHLLTAVAAGTMALGISSAKAADIEPIVEPSGWYVSLFGGVSFLDDVKTDYTFDGDPDTYEANIDTDVGFIVGGAIGTHLTEDFRVELEVAYSENDVDKIEYVYDGGVGTYEGEGKFGILTFMANLWYDVPLSEELKPYIGGGAGIAVVDGDVGYDPDEFPDFAPIFDNSEVAFAFQVGAGLRWQVWDNVALDVGYRLRGIDGPSFDSKVDETPTQAGTSSYDADWIWSHNVIAGISFGF